MGLYNNGRTLNEGYRSGGAWQAIYHCGQLAWEAIIAFLFTSDGFGVQTKDGYIIKCKDQ